MSYTLRPGRLRTGLVHPRVKGKARSQEIPVLLSQPRHFYLKTVELEGGYYRHRLTSHEWKLYFMGLKTIKRIYQNSSKLHHLRYQGINIQEIYLCDKYGLFRKALHS